MLRKVAAGLVVALALVGTAAAQNMSLRAPDWAARLVASDLLPTTGGRAALAGEGVEFSVRATIAPYQGGVARVIRYEARGDGVRLFLRRFTGHPNAGWWLYGPDTPFIATPAAATRADLERLARTAASAVSTGAAVEEASCPAGARVFVEMFVGGRSISVTRDCMGADAAGLLARRLSDLAGSADEEALHNAVIEELLAVDRAFSARAGADGLAAAFRAFAASDARVLQSGAAPIVGPDAIAAAYGALPAGTRATWTPQGARIATRGDMGWTWGRATLTPPSGAAQTLNYITVWTRDDEGAWKFAADVGVPGPAN